MIMAEFQKIVVKVGTNVLARADGLLDLTSISHLVDQIAALKQSGSEVILVSSGAVGAGRSLFDVPSAKAEGRVGDGLLVVVESDGRQIGIVVDALLNQQQVVIKSLETNYRQVAGIQGATILGDGRVALIVDTAVLATLHKPLLTRPRAA